MKEILAIVRQQKIGATKEALLKAGFSSITCRKCMGRGKRKVDFSQVMSVLPDMAIDDKVLAEDISELHRLVPKRYFTLVINDEDVKKAVDTIIEANSTGNPGDGKIFVLPITEVYRVRTGESGESTL